MPWNLEHVTDLSTQVKVMNGKIAEKEKGWGCLDCHTMWEYKKGDETDALRNCENCGDRTLQQWMRALKISHVDNPSYLSDAEDGGEEVAANRLVRK
jgi:hypothetical protein